MRIDNKQRAEVLIEALPHIQKYSGKILLVKYGGSAMRDEALKRAVMGDLVLLSLIGVKVVLVHGGGPEITEMLGKLGKKTEFVDGARSTRASSISSSLSAAAPSVSAERTAVSSRRRSSTPVSVLSAR